MTRRACVRSPDHPSTPPSCPVVSGPARARSESPSSSFDLGGRFDARRKSRENNEERRDSGASANVGLIDGRTGRKHRQKDAACRKRLQVVNNFLGGPGGGRPSPTICHAKGNPGVFMRSPKQFVSGQIINNAAFLQFLRDIHLPL
ncbi:hypothetical protein CEXT_389721 [Caerostris extrusa]|uniref:Uncharacterized protein n=1 Tax=Caerostris extrusa TaxID=172846 RepID=A0AAV4XXT5_CAEEX|nr:hypothetical protein CEXT_389721 [Caerostris extrusa]